MQALFPLVTATLACWYVSSSLWVYPHSLSYFNESIGGPMNGPEHLLGSSVDWGQDLRYVKWWLRAHSLDGECSMSLHVLYKPQDLEILGGSSAALQRSDMSHGGEDIGGSKCEVFSFSQKSDALERALRLRMSSSIYRPQGGLFGSLGETRAFAVTYGVGYIVKREL